MSVDGQIEELRCRGMLFGDVGLARRFLETTDYARLPPYWSKFLLPAEEGGQPRFQEGTDFEDVIAVYEFNRRLRNCVREALEDIEVAVKKRWRSHMDATNGPHGYLDPRL